MRLAEDPNYTRLPGSRRTWLGDVQYWVARDHLLLVEVVGWTEKYRRFDLQELVALMVRPTRRRLWLSIGLLIPMFLCIALGLALLLIDANSEPKFVGVLFLGGAGIFLGWLGWVLGSGPTCEVRLTTSVQTLVLPGMQSRRGAERFRATLLAALPVNSTPATAGDAAHRLAETIMSTDSPPPV